MSLSKIANNWDKGPDLNRTPHEFLRAEDYYESKTVSSGRDTYHCEHCGGVIRKGNSSEVHKFYPEFSGYRTHIKCSSDFVDSLRTDEDGDPEY